jgi:hypothetical protein
VKSRKFKRSFGNKKVKIKWSSGKPIKQGNDTKHPLSSIIIQLTYYLISDWLQTHS